MTKEDVNILEYIVVCISEFANRYEMHMRDAYIYLSRYKGIEFLKEFYDVEHTLSFDDVLDDLNVICRKNGGNAFMPETFEKLSNIETGLYLDGSVYVYELLKRELQNKM